MKRLLLAVSFMFSQLAYASDSFVAIAIGYTPEAPVARLQVPADYVAIPVSIQNNSKDALKRADEVEKAFRTVMDKLKQYQDLSVKPGVISLSPQKSKSFASYSSYEVSAQLYVLGPLKPDTSVFSITKRIHAAITSIPLSDETSIRPGSTVLGMDDPEKYRPQLLSLIGKSIADTKKSLGFAGSVEIDGLEDSVAVMQLNEREVILFIDYRLRLQTKAQ